MYPILFQIGSLKIYSYSLFIFLGFMISVETAILLSKHSNLKKADFLDAAFIGIFSGIVGDKILYILQNSNKPLYDLFNFSQYLEGGLVIYGGLILSSICLSIYIKIKKINFIKFCDMAFLVLPLGIAIGRIGCFLNGCCYGIISQSKFGVKYPKFYSVKYGLIGSEAFLEHLHKGYVKHSDLFSMPVYPTQLISSFANLIIFILLLLTYKKIKISGIVPIQFLLLYSIFRFFIEFIRAEPRYYLNLTLSQYISIALFCLSIFGIFKILIKLRL
ncbi:MAG TPA: prolipoprotein diacylglyceryl transferase [bacterium]|nr:prolipoprotein diacylglyceryl transferase [bacterium]HPN32129.1 prolipoprotein diacylglyceryl transferase [bacterium]